MGGKWLDLRDPKHKVLVIFAVISISDQPFCKRHVHTPYFVFLIWIVKISLFLKFVET